ncbi:MAG: serine--tRNA ligase [Flavobacteriales bacterium]|mgnify:CR=1 FL=1|nr:serine--tRNA ligase [Flavobacteriales bacterium]
MLQVSVVREHQEEIIKRLEIRNLNGKELVSQVIELDDRRKKTQQELDANLAEANSISKQIGGLYKEGKIDEANVLKDKTTELKELNHKGSEALHSAENELRQLLYTIPNSPHLSVPKGNSEEHNEVVYEHGEFPSMDDDAKPHWEITDKYDIVDFELGVKIAGAGFPVYKGKGARLQRALVNFFLDNATAAGYREVQPPLLINEASGYGTGQLPDKEGQMYHTADDDLYLIPTAEVPITNIYRDVILKESDFPVKNCGYTQCFRREAGSYGSDVRGLNRLHQFDKVEIVQLSHPDKSYELLDEMVEYIKMLLTKLELPYRVLRLCGGDLGFTAALTYDFEVYSAAQKKWLEVSSVSCFETYQSNRLKLRYKDENGKMQLAHTLNGSALAFPRIIAALLENNQSEKGVKLPKALAEYTGFEYID